MINMEEKKDLKHILVEESIRKKLKIMSAKKEMTIGDVVKELIEEYEKIGGNKL